MARSSRSSARPGTALLAVLVAVSAVRLSAHRLDEYLQAARIAIAPDHAGIELDLTPGIAVAGSVLADIDRDRDGTISTAEERGYVNRVLGALSLDIDGRPAALFVIGSTFASASAMRAGEGTVRVELIAPLGAVSAGPHRLSFRNAHRPDVSVYLANALVPSTDRISVTNQGRDYSQRTLVVDYVLREDKTRLWWGALFGAGLLAVVAFIIQQKGIP